MKDVGEDVKVWKRGCVMCLFKEWENRKIERKFYTNLYKLIFQRKKNNAQEVAKVSYL